MYRYYDRRELSRNKDIDEPGERLHGPFVRLHRMAAWAQAGVGAVKDAVRGNSKFMLKRQQTQNGTYGHTEHVREGEALVVSTALPRPSPLW